MDRTVVSGSLLPLLLIVSLLAESGPSWASEVIVLPRPTSQPQVRLVGIESMTPAPAVQPPRPVTLTPPIRRPAVADATPVTTMPAPAAVPRPERIPIARASQHVAYQPVRPPLPGEGASYSASLPLAATLPATVAHEPITTRPTAYGEIHSNPAAPPEAYCPNGECPVYYRRRPYGKPVEQAMTILDNRAGEPDWYKHYRWNHYGYYPTRWAAWPCNWLACRGAVPEPHPYDREPPQANTRDVPDSSSDRDLDRDRSRDPYGDEPPPAPNTLGRPGRPLAPGAGDNLAPLPNPNVPGRLAAPPPGPTSVPPVPAVEPPVPGNTSDSRMPVPPPVPRPAPNLTDLVPPIEGR